MSTDLRDALRAAAAEEPPGGRDLGEVVRLGSRRVRRRRATLVAVCTAVIGLVAATVLLPGRDVRPPEPLPAKPVQLHVEGAAPLDLDVLTSRRVTWRDPMNDIDYDRYEGLTADGLVLRTRYVHDERAYSVGLLDPDTGRTEWLPVPPRAVPDVTPVELGVDRLVLITFQRMLTYDRVADTWTHSRVPVPEDADVHGWPWRAEMGPDGRAYLMGFSDSHGPQVPDPGARWWSVPVPLGGEPRAEPAYAHRWVSWRGSVRLTGAPSGRLVVSADGIDRVLASGPPDGCTPPEDAQSLPVAVGWAGDRPVATYSCREDGRARTVVYDAEGAPVIEVLGAGFGIGDQDHVVLLGAGDAAATYVLDPESRTLTRVGAPGREGDVDLVDGLILWNESGPEESRRVYDEVWKVARLP